MPQGFSINDLAHLNGMHESYKVADQDNTDPYYFGFINNEGQWYIMKQSTSGSVTSYRYCKGSSGYATAWTNRATQTYDYLSVIFSS